MQQQINSDPKVVCMDQMFCNTDCCIDGDNSGTGTSDCGVHADSMGCTGESTCEWDGTTCQKKATTGDTDTGTGTSDCTAIKDSMGCTGDTACEWDVTCKK